MVSLLMAALFLPFTTHSHDGGVPADGAAANDPADGISGGAEGLAEAGGPTGGTRAGLTSSMSLLTDFDTLYYGSDANDYMAHDLAVADIDQDGLDDIIVTSFGGDGYLDERSDAGHLQIIFGKDQTASGKEVDMIFTDPDVLIFSFDGGDQMGYSIDTGDINKDGYPDIVAGARYGDGVTNNRWSAGDVFIYYGRPRGDFTAVVDLQVSADCIIFGNRSSDLNGFDLAVGDVNGDGYDDIVTGAYGGDGPGDTRRDTGEAYVILGRSTMPDHIALDDRRAEEHHQCVIWGEYNYDYLGVSVACADLDNDGMDDIILGAHGRNSGGRDNAGAGYVVWGRSTWRPNIDLLGAGNRSVVWGARAHDQLARNVAGADIDNDGYGDLIMGAYYGDGPMDARGDGGEVVVVYGRDRANFPALWDVSVADGDIHIYGGDPYDHASSYLTTGDLNGDGHADLLIGAQDADGQGDATTNSGEVYVILGDDKVDLGDEIDLATQADHTIYGRDKDDRLDTVKLGDLDGDGLMDLVMGAPYAKGAQETMDQAGELYVIYQGVPPVKVKEARLVGGGGDNGKIAYAGYGPFSLEVNITNLQGFKDMEAVQVVVDPGGYAAGFTWTASDGSFGEVAGSDPDRLFTITSGDDDMLKIGKHGLTLNFSLLIDWGFADEKLQDVDVTARGIRSPEATLRFPDLFRVENDLELVGNLTARGAVQGKLKEGGWVAGGEEVTLSGFRVVYQGKDGLEPPDDQYSVVVTDAQGRIRTNDTNLPGEQSITIPAGNSTADQDSLTLSIGVIPAASDASNWSFPFKVDADPPDAPVELRFHSDDPLGDLADVDDDRDLFASWDEPSDAAGGGAGSGIAGYYYKLDADNGGTTKGTWTKARFASIINASEGTQLFYVWAVDKVGNIGVAAGGDFTVDLTDPVMTLFEPSGEGWLRETTVLLNATFTDRDGTGVDASTIEYRLTYAGTQESAWQSWTLAGAGTDGETVDVQVTAELHQGTFNHVQWRFKDVAGNGPVISEPIQLRVDSVPLTFRDPGPGEGVVMANASVRASVVVEDLDGSGVDIKKMQYRYVTSGADATAGEWSADGITQDVGDSAESVTLYVDLELEGGADNFVQWRAKDAAGNGWTESPSYRIQVNRPPRVAISEPAATDRFTAGETILFNATSTFDPDGDTLTFYWHSNISGPLSDDVSFGAALPAGLHLISLSVNDGNGHNETLSVSLWVVPESSGGDGGDDGGSDGDGGGSSGGAAEAGGEGDDTTVWLLVALLMVLVAVIASLLIKKRKSDRIIDDHFEKNVQGELRLKRTSIEAELLSGGGLSGAADLDAQITGVGGVGPESQLPKSAPAGAAGAAAAEPDVLMLTPGKPPDGGGVGGSGGVGEGDGGDAAGMTGAGGAGDGAKVIDAEISDGPSGTSGPGGPKPRPGVVPAAITDADGPSRVKGPSPKPAPGASPGPRPAPASSGPGAASTGGTASVGSPSGGSPAAEPPSGEGAADGTSSGGGAAGEKKLGTMPRSGGGAPLPRPKPRPRPSARKKAP